MRMLRPWASMAMIACLAVSSQLTVAQAEDLNPAHVPKDAKWVMHINYEAFSDSKLADQIRRENSATADALKNWMQEKFGIDPPEELLDLTAFSRDHGDSIGSAIVNAKYDATKLETMLRKAKDHRTTDFNGNTIHIVTVEPEIGEQGQGAARGTAGQQPGRTQQTLNQQRPNQQRPNQPGQERRRTATIADQGFGELEQQVAVVMVDQDTLVLASTEGNAKNTLQLLAGDAPSLDGADTPLLTDRVDKAWAYAAAIDLQQLKEANIALPVLAQHERITWSFGKQDDGKFYERANLVAQSEDVASKMLTVVQGVIAYEELWAADNKSLQALIDNAEIEQKGKEVGVQWQGEDNQVVAAMDVLAARVDAWKQLVMRQDGQSRQ